MHITQILEACLHWGILRVTRCKGLLRLILIKKYFNVLFFFI